MFADSIRNNVLKKHLILSVNKSVSHISVGKNENLYFIIFFTPCNLIKSGLLYEVHLNILNIYTQFDTDTKTCKNQKDMFVIKNVKVQYVINVLGRTSLKIENLLK